MLCMSDRTIFKRSPRSSKAAYERKAVPTWTVFLYQEMALTDTDRITAAPRAAFCVRRPTFYSTVLFSKIKEDNPQRKRKEKNMGHIIEILTFPDSMSKTAIQERCDRWGSANADQEERGYTGGGLGDPIQFTRMVFDNYEEAVEYLDKTEAYAQTAVRYYKYPELKETAKMKAIDKQRYECIEKLQKLEEPHYAGVSSKTVTCRNCGSSLATAYCATGWRNRCPVCKAEMRPATVLERVARLREKRKSLENEYRIERKKLEAKNRKAAKLYWAVCCEVHH